MLDQDKKLGFNTLTAFLQGRQHQLKPETVYMDEPTPIEKTIVYLSYWSKTISKIPSNPSMIIANTLFLAFLFFIITLAQEMLSEKKSEAAK